MRIEGPARRTRAARPESHRAWPARAVLLTGLLGAALLIAGTYAVVTFLELPGPRTWFRAWSAERGHGFFVGEPVSGKLTSIPGRLADPPGTPSLVFDIGFLEMERLHAKRAEALEKRTLIQGEDDFVPASIRHEGRTSRIRIRLKGDFTDHLQGDKWSFRVHVRDGDHVHGMRRFSIQHPKTRAFQSEALVMEYFRRVGVLAPRYFFANVTVNGRDIGVMAVEEHFSKELLESQRRREGVIIRFDESLFWTERVTRGINAWRTNRIVSYLNSPIDVFRSGYVAENPALARDHRTAVGLLRGFVEGRLRPSEVFDVAALARFLAASELWEARHGLYWNNLRFYLNPITLRLEPIAFDCYVEPRMGTDYVIAPDEPIIVRMLADPAVFDAYVAEVGRLARNLLDGELLPALGELHDEQLAILRTEFFLLDDFRFDTLRERVEFLASASPERLAYPEFQLGEFPAVVAAHLVKDGERQVLELSNLVPYRVEIVAIRWVDDEGHGVDARPARADDALPTALDATPVYTLPDAARVELGGPPHAGMSLEVVARVTGGAKSYAARARPYAAALDTHPLAAPADAVRRPFLVTDEAAGEMRVRPGRWRVHETLVVPRGVRLVVPAGTTLRFGPGSALVSHGPVDMLGTERSPIRLEPDGDGTWPGVAVLAAGEGSRWTHVTVRDTSGIATPDWSLTGGVTFHGGEVALENCTFAGHRGEDALNIVGGQFSLTGVTIADAASDGLDVDFAHGSIAGGAFRNIGGAGGGDAVDFSGSEATVERCRFEDVSDKAISVGEASRVTVRRVSIANAGTGLAGKDGSRVEIEESTIERAGFAGLLAYVKKPVFGPAEVVARGVSITGVDPVARAQTGSSITLDGAPVPTEEIDVDALYESVMRPGLRR